MNQKKTFYHLTELDRTTYPNLKDQVIHYESNLSPTTPRTYPGYPRWDLIKRKPRLLKFLDLILQRRRSIRNLKPQLPSLKTLSHLLQFSHGITASGGGGPVPSGGSLQALELYLVNFESSWIPSGIYHYDRKGHHLSQLASPTEKKRWLEMVPSLHHVSQGSHLWVIIGDGAKVEEKYGSRGYRFLMLEAGHLMQNLVLPSSSHSCSTVPLGAYFEGEIAREFSLPPNDLVLYVGVCGLIDRQR